MIFVVDLRSPPSDETPDCEVLPSNAPEWERVQANLDAWNWQAISAVWGMLTKPRFRKIIVVVKKSDLLNHFDAGTKEEIRRRYQPLFDNIKLVFPDQRPVYICGAVGAQTEGMQLMAALWEAADEVVQPQ